MAKFMGKGSEESEESQWTPTFCIMKCIITNVKMGRKGRKDRREEWAGGERAGGRENVLGWDALYCIVSTTYWINRRRHDWNLTGTILILSYEWFGLV